LRQPRHNGSPQCRGPPTEKERGVDRPARAVVGLPLGELTCAAEHARRARAARVSGPPPLARARPRDARRPPKESSPEVQRTAGCGWVEGRRDRGPSARPSAPPPDEPAQREPAEQQHPGRAVAAGPGRAAEALGGGGGPRPANQATVAEPAVEAIVGPGVGLARARIGDPSIVRRVRRRRFALAPAGDADLAVRADRVLTRIDAPAAGHAHLTLIRALDAEARRRHAHTVGGARLAGFAAASRQVAARDALAVAARGAGRVTADPGAQIEAATRAAAQPERADDASAGVGTSAVDAALTGPALDAFAPCVQAHAVRGALLAFGAAALEAALDAAA